MDGKAVCGRSCCSGSIPDGGLGLVKDSLDEGREMTVIAARVRKDEIQFAADSMVAVGYRRHCSETISEVKLYKNDWFTWGCSGTVHEANWFAVFASTRKPASCTEIGVSELLLDFVEWTRKKIGEFNSRNSYLIAFENKLFEVFPGIDVSEVSKFSAIGSGCDFALAALHLNHSVREAVEVAKKLNVFCGGDTQEMVHKF